MDVNVYRYLCNGSVSRFSDSRRSCSRSGSQMTLDSIDQLTRYSEDTDRKEEDRLAVLEYELRTSR